MRPSDLNTTTAARRLIWHLCPRRPRWWMRSADAWRLYAICDWAAYRAGELAMQLEEHEERQQEVTAS